MKKTALAGLALAGLALVGCSGGKPEAAPVTTTTVRPTTTTVYRPPSTTTTIKSHASYLVRVSAVLPATPDSDLIDLGQTACDTIDASGSVVAFAAQAEAGFDAGDWGSVTRKELAVVVDAAIREFCPQYVAELNAL